MGRWVTTAVFLAAIGVGLFFWKRSADKDAARAANGRTHGAEIDIGRIRSNKGPIRRVDATATPPTKPEREYTEEERIGIERPEPQKLPAHITDLNTKLGQRVRELLRPCATGYGPEQRIVIQSKAELYEGKTKLIRPAVVRPKDAAFTKCAEGALADKRWEDEGPNAVFVMEASFLVKEM